MPKSAPQLITTEIREKDPILIIDKQGEISKKLLPHLSDQYQVHLLTKNNIIDTQALIYYYGKKIPTLPDEKYTTIIIIYAGEDHTLDMLPSITQKASLINSKILFITELKYFDNNLQKILKLTSIEKGTIAIHTDLFTKEASEDNYLSSMIREARLNGRITIHNSGLSKIYPLYIDDLIDAIIDLSFSHSSTNDLIIISPKHGFTLLGAARRMQKINPLLKIGFTKNKLKIPEYSFPRNAKYYFSNYYLESRLKHIGLDKLKTLEAKKIKKTKPGTKKYSAPSYFIFSLILIYLLLPILLLFTLLASGSIFLSLAIKIGLDNNLTQASHYNNLSRASFSSSHFLINNSSLINPIIGSQKEFFLQKINIGTSLVDISGNFFEAANLMKSILTDNSANPKTDFLLFTSKIKNNLVALEKLRAEGELPSIFKQKLKNLDYPLALLGSSIDTFPDILGFYGKKRYLILFQNNMEIRPGGGFIGSYAILEVSNAKSTKFEIRDVYDSDGKLSTHLEPPYALRRYLGASHLFLRDSNFDPDFINNAQSAQKILELETKEKTDGVIAIDTNFLKRLIALFGPIYIPDYKQTVNAQNFYLLTQQHAEKDFFPGSTQKKDFLRALYSALETSINDNKTSSLTPVMEELGKALKEKNILIYFSDPQTQSVFMANNLSGSLSERRVRSSDRILDFLGINEANLGLNKTNFYLKRSVDQKVAILPDGKIKNTVAVTYSNTSSSYSEFGGDYKNYIRFVLPEDAVLENVEVNDQRIATVSAITDPGIYTQKTFKAPSELEIEETIQNGKKIFGFLVVVPKQTSQKISIHYRPVQSSVLQNDRLNYSLYVFKQPGTLSDPISLSISYPAKYHAVNFPESFVDVGGKLVYSGSLSEDLELNLEFSQE